MDSQGSIMCMPLMWMWTEKKVLVKKVNCDRNNIYMRRKSLSILLTAMALVAMADNSPYIARVYDYMPAPGQFVNVMPPCDAEDTQDSINARVEARLCGVTSGSGICLGGYGGYVVFGFDHPVVNSHDYDVKIYGNAMQSASSGGVAGGSAEPGIIVVGVDEDGDGFPSSADRWYEIAGGMYSQSQHGYTITYYKPVGALTDTIRWTSNDVNPDSTSGHVERNSFHSQAYWPMWATSETLTFTGTKIPNTAYVLGGSWFLPFLGEGYVDNLPNNQEQGFKIDWAVDDLGRNVSLDHIDFVKVYTGQLQVCGWLGETSTEIYGAEDLHPDVTAALTGDVNCDGTLSMGDVTTLIAAVLGNQPDPYNASVADMNCDGTLSMGDVTTLIAAVLGE